MRPRPARRNILAQPSQLATIRFKQTHLQGEMLALGRYREHLTTALYAHHPAPPEPIRTQDEPLLKTCLRRALRRKEAGYVFGAASALLDCDPRKLWKEIAVIALKDFALADLPLFGSIIAAASNKSWRDKSGGDWHIASHLLLGLLKTPCDRRLRKLQLAARNSHTDAHETLGSVIADAEKILGRCERRVSHFVIPGFYASECDAALAEAGKHHMLDKGLIEVCIQARRTTQSILPVLLPLVITASASYGGTQSRIRRKAPETRDIGGLPSYVFDASTQTGHRALNIWMKEAPEIGRMIAAIPSMQSQVTLRDEALFAMEGGVCVDEVSDAFYRELSIASMKGHEDVPDALVMELRAAMRSAIPLLNDIREFVHVSKAG